MPFFDKVSLMSSIDKMSYRKLMFMQSDKQFIGFAISDYIKLHAEIFNGVQFAGRIRTNTAWKGGYFVHPARIKDELTDVLRRFREWAIKPQNDHTLDIDTLCENYSYLNSIHPFSDGNGRTQREFLRRVLCMCGYTIDLSDTYYRDMAIASNAAMYGNKTLLKEIFLRHIKDAKNTVSAGLFYRHLTHLAILSSDDIDLAIQHEQDTRLFQPKGG